MASLFHPTTAILHVDLASLITNYQLAQALAGPKARVAAVVKSDAYGLGLLSVARGLWEAGCPDFFVANLAEGAALRAELPDATINVLFDDIPGALEDYRRDGLTPVVNTWEDFARIKREDDGSAYILNVETGFSRLGLSYEAVRAAYFAGDLRRRTPRLLMSHLACSHAAGSALNERQRHRFAAMRQLLPTTQTSLAASAGLWLGQAYHGDVVRIGSALYGLNTAGLVPSPLAPVVRLSAQILHVSDVARHEAVGYAATFRTDLPSRIAVLGLGYRQGLPWACANRIAVRIGSFSAPVVGRVSMEYMNLDVTDVPESVATRGAWVDILHEAFTPDDLGEVSGANGQEVLTRLGSGVPRHYAAWLPERHAWRPPAEVAPRPAGDRPGDRHVRPPIQAVAMVILAGLAWSTAGLFVRLLPLDMWTVTFWRSLIGGVLITLHVMTTGRPAGRNLRNAWGSGLAVTACMTISMLAFIPALSLTAVANVAVIYATMPIIAAILARIWLGERLSRSALTCAVVIVCGAIVLVASPRGSTHPFGDALALLMTVTMAMVAVIIRRSNGLSLAVFLAIANLLVAAVALPMAKPLSISVGDLTVLSLFALVQVAIGYLAFNFGARRLPAASTALLGTIEAPLAPLWVWLVFKETPPSSTLIGGAVILSAMLAYLVSAFRARPASSSLPFPQMPDRTNP